MDQQFRAVKKVASYEMCYTQSIGLRKFLWNDLRNRKYTWDYKVVVLKESVQEQFR